MAHEGPGSHCTSPRWWLLADPVDTFFAIIARHAIHCGSFTSIDNLVSAIRAYTDAYDERCEPFVWTKIAEEILSPQNRRNKRRQRRPTGTVADLCRR